MIICFWNNICISYRPLQSAVHVPSSASEGLTQSEMNAAPQTANYGHRLQFENWDVNVEETANVREKLNITSDLCLYLKQKVSFCIYQSEMIENKDKYTI